MMILKSPWPAKTLYIVVEIDHFSAQALTAYNPRYAALPFVVVRQDADSHKSFIWACSVKAKEKKIKRGKPLQLLKRKFPALQVFSQDKEIEKVVVNELVHIIKGYTPDYTKKGDGSFLLDFSPILKTRPAFAKEISEQLKLEIVDKVRLQEVAIGISQSKLIARIMSRLAKPNRIRICEPGKEKELITFLDYRYLPELSPLCREKLKKYGLKKVGQIQQLKKDDLVARLGAEGEKLYAMVQGNDLLEKRITSRPLYSEVVFKKDINHEKNLVRYIRHTADQLCFQLKNRQVLIKKLTFVLIYTDYKRVQKTVMFGEATEDFSLIARKAVQLFFELYTRRVAVKLVRLIVKDPYQRLGQLSLFESRQEKKGRLFRLGINQVRNKLHFSTLFSAAELGVVIPKKKGRAEADIQPQDRAIECCALKEFHSGVIHKDIRIGISGSFAFNPWPAKRKHEAFKRESKQTPWQDWQQYQSYFSFAEIHHTHYNEPIPADFKKIEQFSKKSMIFSVMVNRSIGQPKRKDKALGRELMLKHIGAIGPLLESGRFFAFVIQLADGEYRSQQMLEYLLEVGSVAVWHHLDVHIEFRHVSWQTDYVLRSLQDNGIGICNTDIPPLDQSFPLSDYATTEKGYIRYNGRNTALWQTPSAPVRTGSGQGRINRYCYTYSEAEIKERLDGQMALSKKVSQMAIVYNNQPQIAAFQNACQNTHLLKS